MKYIKQIKVFRDNVEFESEIRMFSRFAAKDSNNEIDAATKRDKKRKELDKDNEYTSTPTCTRTKMNIVSEAQGEEVMNTLLLTRKRLHFGLATIKKEENQNRF
ncbi:unnamed protein product [Rhizophagus irregularis]|nr:unnamed protein product [Rhizophagus irregularis]